MISLIKTSNVSGCLPSYGMNNVCFQRVLIIQGEVSRHSIDGCGCSDYYCGEWTSLLDIISYDSYQNVRVADRLKNVFLTQIYKNFCNIFLDFFLNFQGFDCIVTISVIKQQHLPPCTESLPVCVYKNPVTKKLVAKQVNETWKDATNPCIVHVCHEDHGMFQIEETDVSAECKSCSLVSRSLTEMF